MTSNKHPLITQLIGLLGPEAVVEGEALRARAVSHWDAGATQALAMVRPESTEQVSQVLRLCHQLGQPVVMQGGRTGCAQGCIALESELILSLERMKSIESIDAVGSTAIVQAGAILEVVQNTVAEQGLRFPLDLGARGSCTIGGNIATNAGGINVLRYGMMRQLVLGLEVVMADGTVVSSMNQMLKNNSGYDLKQLFIGTEGTLGVVTRAVLRLFPAPLSCHSALVGLDSFEQVTQLLSITQRELAGTLSAFEVMWGDYFVTVTEPGWHVAPMSREYRFYVIVEAEGADDLSDGVRFQALLERALEQGLIADAVVPKSESERRRVWGIREDFEALYANGPTFLYDISLPIKDMLAYVKQVKHGLLQRWPAMHCYVIGHIADGNLHLFITPGAMDATHEQCDIEVYTPLKQWSGAVSAEHGIGLEKKAWLGQSRSAAEIELMKTMKALLDPKGLLNRGRVF